MEQNSPTIATTFTSMPNNFDLLRLCAALLVLFSHSFPLTGFAEPIARSGYGDGGSLAVSIFFAISGFLVTRSVLSRDFTTYFVARAVRILPALAVVVLLQALVLGPIFTTLTLNDYFSSHATYSHLKSVFIFNIHFQLPGVFQTLPHHSVNGSLWTLPLEVACYLILPFLVIGRILKPLVAWLLVLATAVALTVSVHWAGLGWTKPGPALFGSASTYPFLKYALFFVIGSALWIYRSAIPLNAGAAACCFVLLYAGSNTFIAPAILYLTLPYLVIYFALSVPVAPSTMKRLGDLSYGAYLYAFPVQQSLIQISGGSIAPLRLTAYALPIVLALAWLSFHLIEKPALKFKGGRAPREPRTADLPVPPIRVVS
ncbi:acyltransferase family protein [Microvirga ossetica]|uniref:acyltransferase family protein n=1 Tax=Microvirga ossetica TaxID=1882682 RepID=UPI000C14EE43|nr:acyltransferase [Microvirga ossetica]